MEFEVAFNFIYTICYNGLEIFLTFKKLLTRYMSWNNYLGVAFYTYHNLLKHMQQF
jgi:hypothetical protein